jgi:hypothetical protein
LMAVVVLPTPPFWFTTPSIFPMAIKSKGSESFGYGIRLWRTSPGCGKRSGFQERRSRESLEGQGVARDGQRCRRITVEKGLWWKTRVIDERKWDRLKRKIQFRIAPSLGRKASVPRGTIPVPDWIPGMFHVEQSNPFKPPDHYPFP